MLRGISYEVPQHGVWATVLWEKSCYEYLKQPPSQPGLPRCSGKRIGCQSRRHRKIPWRRKWPPTPVFLPVKSHGHRSLVGYSPWGCKESDTTKHAHRPSPPIFPEGPKMCMLNWDCLAVQVPGRNPHRTPAPVAVESSPPAFFCFPGLRPLMPTSSEFL